MFRSTSQRHPSRETAIERSTETAWQRQLRALLVSLLEPIFEEDAIEARFFAKMKDEADLEIRRREASKRVIAFVPRGSFRCRPVFVVRSFPFPAVGETRALKHSVVSGVRVPDLGSRKEGRLIEPCGSSK